MRLNFMLIFIGFFVYLTGAAQSPYFLCGPDEDGCSSAYYTSCLCMPIDVASFTQPYCLDFDKLACIPLAIKPNCPTSDIVKNQASCLALAFQSEAEPPCKKVTEEFCIKHHIPRCEQDGGLASCKLRVAALSRVDYAPFKR